jgi:hypothetical protein
MNSSAYSYGFLAKRPKFRNAEILPKNLSNAKMQVIWHQNACIFDTEIQVFEARMLTPKIWYILAEMQVF